jgi:hypothetical protein
MNAMSIAFEKAIQEKERKRKMKKIIFVRKQYRTHRLAWVGSPFEEANKLSIHEKGRFGAEIVKAYLEFNSKEPYIKLSKGGDLRPEGAITDAHDVEVKTAFAKVNEKTGIMTFLWNQIRPGYSWIKHTFLVAVFPTVLKIFILDSNKINFTTLKNGHDLVGKVDARDKCVNMSYSGAVCIFDVGPNPQPDFVVEFERNQIEIV